MAYYNVDDLDVTSRRFSLLPNTVPELTWKCRLPYALCDADAACGRLIIIF